MEVSRIRLKVKQNGPQELADINMENKICDLIQLTFWVQISSLALVNDFFENLKGICQPSIAETVMFNLKRKKKSLFLLIVVEISMISWPYCIWACNKTVVDPQDVIQLVQQWLAVNGKFNNPQVAQSTRLYVSEGLQYTLES